MTDKSNANEFTSLTLVLPEICDLSLQCAVDFASVREPLVAIHLCISSLIWMLFSYAMVSHLLGHCHFNDACGPRIYFLVLSLHCTTTS